MTSEAELKEREAKLKTLDFLWKMADSSFEKNFRMANLAAVGNAAGLLGCLTIFRDFKDKIALDVLSSAGFAFCAGMMAATAMLAMTWLISELSAIIFGRVAANEFSDDSWTEFGNFYLSWHRPDLRHQRPALMTLSGTIMAIPYLISILCFFVGIWKVGNHVTCWLACT